MTKRKPKQKKTDGKQDGVLPMDASPKTKSTVEVDVGEEPMPGVKLHCICHGHKDSIKQVAWSPCGRFIATPSEDKTIRVWDVHGGDCLAVLKGHSAPVLCLAWSPDSSRIVSCGLDDNVIFWNVNKQVSDMMFEHNSYIDGIAWSFDGNSVAAGTFRGQILIWNLQLHSKKVLQVLPGRINNLRWLSDNDTIVYSIIDGGIGICSVSKNKNTQYLEYGDPLGICVTLSSDEKSLASGGKSSTITIWDFEKKSKLQMLEGHTGQILSLSYNSDNRVLASQGEDNKVILWDINNFNQILSIRSYVSKTLYTKSFKISFSPNSPLLTTYGKTDTILRVWELDIDSLVGKLPAEKKITFTSAKVVLVGESNVGKSCLAMRLAENRYPDDKEHITTHGMRLWSMKAKDLHSSAAPPEGERRDLVLWDLGGQEEYKLVHQIFLHDTTMALVLIEPTRGQVAMDEARDWNKRLEKQLDGQHAIKFLVGAKQDRKNSLINHNKIEILKKECGFKDFIDVSAKTGRNIERLRKIMAETLNWDKLLKVSRPELFQNIRDEIELRRKRNEVVLLLAALNQAVIQKTGKLYDKMAVETVTAQLATQGIIVRTKLTSKDEVLVLQLPVIERYAGSLIVAARNNPRRVPVLEERLLGQLGNFKLPGMEKMERLRDQEENTVLECVVELMIQHGLCFRHSGLLVFPTLFSISDSFQVKLPHSVSLYYDFTGAIDNIFASLVARLVISEEFGEGRLWSGRVEFDSPSVGICGLRQIKRAGGLAHIDLFFDEDTSIDRRNLFTRFVEDHLRINGVEIKEHESIKCVCGEVIEERIIQANIKRREKDVICPVCRSKTLIGKGVDRIRELDPESDSKIFALRKKVDLQTEKEVAIAKSHIYAHRHKRQVDDPIRILHLSDLHFDCDTSHYAHFVPLIQDIRKGDYLGFDSIEYLIISGDMTDRGSDEGLDKAREFCEWLIEDLDLSAQRCFFVPGNHDVKDLKASYGWTENIDGLEKDQWVKKDDIYLVRDNDEYPKRLKRFSDTFFHKILPAQPYPLDPGMQGISYLFEDTQIQFLAFNSAWKIDQFNRKRSNLNPDAVAYAIAEADKQIDNAIKRQVLMEGQNVLRLCVWHHSIQHPEMMQCTASVELLQAAAVRLCLHGDVHEMNRDHFKYWYKKKMDVIGAGSFGSPAKDRPESTPRLYNLLEIQRDHSSIRVHTRRRDKLDGPWDGWHEWENPSGTGRIPYYDINLT